MVAHTFTCVAEPIHALVAGKRICLHSIGSNQGLRIMKNGSVDGLGLHHPCRHLAATHDHK